MQDIKIYEDKMNKTLDNLLEEFGTVPDVRILTCWTSFGWTITDLPRPFSR